MSLITKETEILATAKERNFKVFGREIPKEKFLDLFERQLLSFVDYVNIVVREQIMLPIWRLRCEAEDLRYNTEQIDRQRRTCHDTAIMAIGWLNRVCSDFGMTPFADVDTEDRKAVAEVVGNFVGEAYGLGIGQSFDAVSFGRTEEYDREVVRNLVKGGE